MSQPLKQTKIYRNSRIEIENEKRKRSKLTEGIVKKTHGLTILFGLVHVIYTL